MPRKPKGSTVPPMRETFPTSEADYSDESPSGGFSYGEDDPPEGDQNRMELVRTFGSLDPFSLDTTEDVRAVQGKLIPAIIAGVVSAQKAKVINEILQTRLDEIKDNRRMDLLSKNLNNGPRIPPPVRATIWTEHPVLQDNRVVIEMPTPSETIPVPPPRRLG